MKKKILITTSGFPLSINDGESQFMLEYARSLQSLYDVYILAPLAKGSLKEENWDGIKVFRHRQGLLYNPALAYESGIMVNIRKNPLLILSIPWFIVIQARHIVRLVKKEQIDIVNAHWLLPQGFCMALLKAFGCKPKFILTIHSGSFWDFGKFPFKLIRNFTLRKCDACIGISKALEKGAAEVIGEKAHYLPLGVHLDRYERIESNDEIAKKYGLEGKKVLCLIGAMIERKGVEPMVSAMPDILKIHPDTVLMMIGEGALLENMQLKAKDLGINDKVIFTGRINHEEVAKFLSVCDLLCVPSISEGYPVVVKEAMASSVLVMSSSLPGLVQDALLNDIIYYIPNIKPESISNKVNDILNKDEEELDQRRAQGKNYMKSYGDWTNLSKQFDEIASR